MKCDFCENNVVESGENICGVVGVSICKINKFESEKCMIFKERELRLVDKIKDMNIDRMSLFFVYKDSNKYKSTLIEGKSFKNIDEAKQATCEKLMEVCK